MKLHPIGTYSLTLLESEQFINRQLTDIRVLGGSDLSLNEDLNGYLTQLDTCLSALASALLVVRKSDETIKIHMQDDRRDQAFTILKNTAAFYERSNSDEEHDAALSLKTLFATYKNLTALNYEAESRAIDHLLNDLGNSKYEPMIEILELGQAVNRLRTMNDQFKSLFDGRIQGTSTQETFNAKLLRNEMLGVYNDFAAYILTMAKLKSSPAFFTDLLSILNIGRKYYADMLARRKGVAAETV